MTALTTLYKLTPVLLAKWVANEYGISLGTGFGNPHRLRRETIAQRLRLYRDDAQLDFERMINAIFETESVQKQRKKMIEVASELNVTARIIDEVASLYDQPAARSFKGNDAMTQAFHDRAMELELDEVMQEAHRLTYLCNETLLWQVQVADGEKAELHIVTPDSFDAIPHPANKLRAAGFLIDAKPGYIPPGADRAKVKFYELWDDEFTYHLNPNGELIGDPIAHGLKRIPGALFHRRKPVDRLLDCRAGRDITSAHLGAALLEIMIMRLAKSQGERQPVLVGPMANVAANQAFDGERPIVLPPDVVADMLDSKTSPDHYLLAKKDKLTSVALRHGMSYEQMIRSGGDGDSGAAFIARRLKLTELRLEQRRRARVHEREMCSLIGFDPATLRVDHQEQAVPADAAEEIALLKEKLRLGLDSVVDYLMRKDPDLSRHDAVLLIKSNVRDWAMLIEELRILNAPAGADASDPGKSPEENGADNGSSDDGSNDGSGTPIAEFAKKPGEKPAADATA